MGRTEFFLRVLGVPIEADFGSPLGLAVAVFGLKVFVAVFGLKVFAAVVVTCGVVSR